MHTVATHSPTYLHYVWCLGPLGVISVEIVELFTFTLPRSTSACCQCVCVCWFAHVCMCFVFLLLLFLQKSAALLHFKHLHLSHCHMFYPLSCRNHSIVSSHSISAAYCREIHIDASNGQIERSSCQGMNCPAQFKEINIIYGEKL